jgi:hypothetical protein
VLLPTLYSWIETRTEGESVARAGDKT